MKEAEILKFESEHLRHENGYRTAYLFLQGTFLRAFGYSAFLMNRYCVQDMKVTRLDTGKGLKIFVGFPNSSRDKYLAIPDAVISAGEERVDILFPESLMSEETPDTLAQGYNNWVSCLPKAQQTKKETELPAGTMLSVIHDIISFPIEQKTLMECVNFLIDTRQKLLKLM